MQYFLKGSVLIIILISSIFFSAFLNVFFSRNFPPTATNVQKVSSIMIFSLSFVELSLIKSKFIIFSWSLIVWVNESKILISPCRVMLKTRFLQKVLNFKKSFKNITITFLIWGLSNWRCAPKLINKQWYLSISSPSSFQ